MTDRGHIMYKFAILLTPGLLYMGFDTDPPWLTSTASGFLELRRTFASTADSEGS